MQSKPSRRPIGHTEATRLLCAGVHLDATFRRRVIDELVGHAERPVAPALGADLLPVLAHALRARREELRTALLLLAVWVGFVASDVIMIRDTLEDRMGGQGLSTGDLAQVALDADDTGVDGPFSWYLPGWTLSYALVVLFLWLTRVFSGRGTDTAVLRRVKLPAPLAWLQTRFGWLLTTYAWVFGLVYWYQAFQAVTETPYPVIFPLLLTVVMWRHRTRRKATMRTALTRQTFAETPWPDLPDRYGRIADCIRREQDASLALYDAHRPFVGAGTPRKPWSLVLELRPADKAAAGVIDARAVIDMIRPRLEALRESPSPTGRDRLRELEIEEFVYLPSGVGRDEPLHSGAEPLPDGDEQAPAGPKSEGVYGPAEVARHLAESVGEGGEARRHFLRIRVGAWNEQVVVSLLVRVHTQGRMLVLEVVPHVLGPIVPEFRAVDAIVAREPEGPVRDAVRALIDAPAVGLALGIAAARALRSAVRLWLAAPDRAAPDAPLVSLRELAGTDELSLFQEMDVARYVKTLQDRIGEGVRDALHDRGYRTDRLEQNITTIHNSGLYINEMSGGAVATGTHGQATHTERSTV